MSETELRTAVDFTDTEIAFSYKSDQELKKMAWLFGLMNHQWIVNLTSGMALWATRLRLPFSEKLIEKTIFEQFCGGKTLLECQPVIDKLNHFKTATVLDYGVEAKSSEEELDFTLREILKAVEFAASNASVPVVSTKLTGLADNAILEAWQDKRPLTEKEQKLFERVEERVDTLCARGHALGVCIYIDAEESWVQDTIDHLCTRMMAKYNHDKAVVYNTYQLYRVDHLQLLKDAHQKALEGGYLLGAKLVRGAYMHKERERAREMGYPDLIQPDKAATDRDYNAAIRYCVEHYETIASCNASHNVESNKLQADLIAAKDLPKSHPHLNFSQLLGMSDIITFNLAEAGYNAAKYVPYGAIRDVIPYLIRRAQENTSVTGDMGRELFHIKKELKRRGLRAS